MFGMRVVVYSHVLQLLHKGHLGVVRVKLLDSSYVWWPSLAADIDMFCKNCTLCSIVIFSQDSRVQIPWPAAKKHFQRVHVDFCELEQQTYFIYCDSFSKWIGVQDMKTTTAKDVNAVLLNYFTIWGFPRG